MSFGILTLVYKLIFYILINSLKQIKAKLS